MNDSQRPPLPVSATALQRYLVVAEVEALVLRGWRPGAAVRHVAGADHRDLDGPVSVRSLQRWRAAWAAGNLAALEPQQRTPHRDLTGAEWGTGRFSEQREAA